MFLRLPFQKLHRMAAVIALVFEYRHLQISRVAESEFIDEL
jgi:hypothetical protein